jgi:hypothetical protein
VLSLRPAIQIHVGVYTFWPYLIMQCNRDYVSNLKIHLDEDFTNWQGVDLYFSKM